jgi:PPOX class probable F420-dependent enzyme
MTQDTETSLIEYLQAHRTGVLATTNRNGRPQQTLIAYQFDGRDMVISTRAPTLKAKNISKRPDVSLAVIDGQRQVVVYGKARIIRDFDEVLRINQERLRKIALRAETDDELADRLKREERVVIVLTPEHYFPPALR